MLFAPGLRERTGIAKRADLLSAGLAGRGWDVRVIARSPSSRAFAVLRSPGRVATEVPGFGHDRLATALFFVAGVPLGWALGRRPAVYVGLKLFSTTTAAAWCGRLRHRPFIAMATTSGPAGEAAHLRADPSLRPANRGAAAVFDRRMAAKRRALQRSSAVVAQTDVAARELAEVLPASRIVTVPNPVRVLADPPPLDGRPRAAFTGRLSGDKGLPGLLEAWSTAAGSRPGAHLTLVGGEGRHEPAEDVLRRAISADPILRSTVTLTGWVSDVGPHLGASDLFVLCSEHEGMSNALLEACAYGRVVVASDIAGNRAVVGDDYPLLFPPGRPDLLAETLGRALDDPGVRARARARVLEAAQACAVERVVDRIEALLVEVAGAAAGAAGPAAVRAGSPGSGGATARTS